MSNAYLENEKRRKKDAKVAIWMGWIGVGKRRRVIRGSTSDEERWEGLSSNTADSLTEIPRYTSSWNDIHHMELAIKSRGLLWEYSQELALSVVPVEDRIEKGQYGIIGECLLATPEQRVNSLLRLIGEFETGI